jgi:hypothetical protein
MKNNRAISYLAVSAVVLALLFFTTVRISPVATDAAALNQVNHKQRVMKIDVAVCIDLAPRVIAFLPLVGPIFPAESRSIPVVRPRSQHFNRPPPALA